MHVADSVRERSDEELQALRDELQALRGDRLDPDVERRILFLRCFATERTLYLEMLRKGHLSERAYRDLEHSVVSQSDSIRHMGKLPDFTLHPPVGERVTTGVMRAVGHLPGLRTLAERLREGAAERDYETTWARFHGDGDVLEDLERLRGTGSHREVVLDEVAALYAYWRENARGRMDQTAEVFPEFVAATQERLAERLALEAEKATIQAQARTGGLPSSVSGPLLHDLGDRLDAVAAMRTGKIVADPHELLQKVPFFQGLADEDFHRIAAHLHQRTAPRGDEIVRQGERGSALFLVARGVVRVTVRRPDGDDATIATLMAGDFFGEMALLHGGVRTATCTAVTPCALYELSRADLDAVRADCPTIQDALEAADRQRRDELDA